MDEWIAGRVEGIMEVVMPAEVDELKRRHYAMW